MDNQEKKQEIKDPIFFPMLVDDEFGIQDSEETIMRRWDVFNALPEEKKDRMLANDIPFVIKGIGEKYSLSVEEVAYISRIVRDLFFEVVSEEKIEIELEKRIPKFSDVQSRDVARTISRNILNSDISKIRREAGDVVGLSLNDALSKYPGIGEQTISYIPLKLRISPNPVKPSVKNWIADYREQMGMGKHGTFDRGNFLFHGENSKKLTAVERQKLSAILKSLDDETPLSINPDKQEIIFENLQTDERTQQIVAPVDAKPEPDAAAQSNMQSANTAAQTTRQPFMQAMQPRPVISQSKTQVFQKPTQEASRPMPSPSISMKPSGAKQFTVKGSMPQVTSANFQPNVSGIGQNMSGFGQGTSMADMARKKMQTFDRKVTDLPKAQATVGEMIISPKTQKQSVAPISQLAKAAPLQHMNLETGEKIDNYFGVQSSGARMETFPKEAPTPKREFENKSPNFSQLLKSQDTQAGNVEKVAEKEVQKKPVPAPAPMQPKSAAGKISFSSPQQFSVEQKAVPKRSPYRITPREDE